MLSCNSLHLRREIQSRTLSSADQELGIHPETGGKICLKQGPYGPFVEMVRADAGSKPIRAPLPPALLASPEISLEAAIELLQWPKVLAILPIASTGQLQMSSHLHCMNVFEQGPRASQSLCSHSLLVLLTIVILPYTKTPYNAHFYLT